MKSIARQFAVVFFVGFIALTAALAFGSATSGTLLDDQPFLAALRWFGLGWMAAGMALWVVLRRDEAGSSELSPLLAMLIGLGCAVLVIVLFLPFSSVAVYLIWGGIGLTFAALAIGVLAMVFKPAYPRPVTVRWPGEDETHAAPSVHTVSNPSEVDTSTTRAVSQAKGRGS